MPKYTIHRARTTPEGQGLWDGPAWKSVPSLEIDWFHPRSTSHHPRTRVKIAYGDERIHLIFRVDDRFVRATRTQRNSNVCRDSCVEFFVEPKPGKGYFNFEFNAGGTMLLHFNRTAPAVRYAPLKLPQKWRDMVPVYHSLPRLVSPEIKKPTTWYIETSAPYALFEAYIGKLGKLPGATWRANCYKCGVTSTHTHWASWNPVGDPLSFHRPEIYGPMTFARK